MSRRDWTPSANGAVTNKLWAQAVHSVADRQLSTRQAAQRFGLQQAALHRLVRQHALQSSLQQNARRQAVPPMAQSMQQKSTMPMQSLSQSMAMQPMQSRQLQPTGLLGPLRSPATSSSPSDSDDSRHTVATSSTRSRSSATDSDGGYVFPRLHALAIGHCSPDRPPVLPAVATVSPRLVTTQPQQLTQPPPSYELTPELNDEVVAVLRDQFMQQCDDDDDTTDGRYDFGRNSSRLEGYADADIADVTRAIVGRNGRRALPANFPSANWLTTFRRENDFIDVTGMSRQSSSNFQNVRDGLSSQRDGGPAPFTRDRYDRRYELERQQYELEGQLRRGLQRWGRSEQTRNYRQSAAPPPTSPLQHSPRQGRAPYSWDDVGGRDNQSQQSPKRFYQAQRPQRDEFKFRRSPSAGSSSSINGGHSDSNSSDRSYRQSNMVPAEVWERAMEAVAIHGMSLRNAAKAHGVHFAALHRRLKKRQQHKLSLPCEPNYIPFEDEAGVVRVIHARAEMGVLLTFAELVDLLKRTSLKHRSELPEDVARALVLKFQSRVEQSVRHLIIDWPTVTPAPATNVLYRLRDGCTNDGSKDEVMTSNEATETPVPAERSSLPSIISASGGESGSSSGSSSSLSPHPQTTAAVPVMRKSLATAAPMSWRSNNRDATNNGGSSNNDNNVEVGSKNDRKAATATVSPSDDNEMPTQPCMILRL